MPKSLPAFHKPQPSHLGGGAAFVGAGDFVVYLWLSWCVCRMNVAIIISSQNSSQYLSGKTQHVGKL